MTSHTTRLPQVDLFTTATPRKQSILGVVQLSHTFAGTTVVDATNARRRHYHRPLRWGRRGDDRRSDLMPHLADILAFLGWSQLAQQLNLSSIKPALRNGMLLDAIRIGGVRNNGKALLGTAASYI